MENLWNSWKDILHGLKTFSVQMCIFSTSVTFFHMIPKPSFLTYLQWPLGLSRLTDLSDLPCRNAFKIFTVKVIHSALRPIPITGVSSLPQPLLTFCHSLLLRKGSCRVRSYIFRSIYPPHLSQTKSATITICAVLHAHPQSVAWCDSCSSGRNFAASFFQSPRYRWTPCLKRMVCGCDDTLT